MNKTTEQAKPVGSKNPAPVEGVLQRKWANGNYSPHSVCNECALKNWKFRRTAHNKLKGADASPFVDSNIRTPNYPNSNEMSVFFEPHLSYDFSHVGVHAHLKNAGQTQELHALAGNAQRFDSTPSKHIDGIEEEDQIRRPIIEQFRLQAGLPASSNDESGQRVGTSDAEKNSGGLRNPPTSSPAKSAATPVSKGPAVTPCPTSVSVGSVVQSNHSNLSATEKENWGTWLSAMSRMDVGPGPDHTGHCMKERLTTKSNSCPATIHSRGGTTTQPCSGNRCLDINRYGKMGGVSDGPAAFLDMHRTKFRNSLLEGTGVNSCSVVCEQTYTCDRTQPTTGTFSITRNFQAGSHTRTDGTTMHITTGTVTKT